VSFKAIILAAGKGTRFKSELPKVLHKILGKPMLWFVIRAAQQAGADEVIVVVGHKRELVEEFLKAEFPDVKTAYQREQLGTGHAVMVATEALRDCNERVVVLNGDAPLVKAEDISALAEVEGDMVVLTGMTDEPSGYGRIVRDGQELIKIVEEKDATPEEKKIKEVNSGIYAFDCQKLLSSLSELDRNNAQGEYYLTDLVKIFKRKGYKISALLSKDFDSLRGVNNRHELSIAEEILRKRIIKKLQLSGITVRSPESVYIEPEVEIGTDSEIWGPTYIKGKSRVGKGCTVAPFTQIEDSVIEDGVQVESHSWIRGAILKEGSSVGPFAKIREGTVLERDAKVGTFVETKKALLEEGAKANHLTYLGDCRVGRGTNVGAGTITCNYDGFNKWFTDIGEKVFVGSNTLFIAPVKVGDGAITAAGSVITQDVPPDALAVGRARQVNLEGRAALIREKAKKRGEKKR
jgi:bifunctional UDP-N-acetylglucosamine pyrophosphorylase/glucosamine-1-phosphate N-acetyltransferase